MRTPTTRVRLTDRTLSIGHEMYQLSNISRVSKHRLPPPRPRLSDTGVLAIGGIWVIGGIVSMALLVQGQDTVGAFMLTGLVVGTIWARYHFEEMRPWLYALSLESAGNVKSFLLSEHPSAVEDLMKQIVSYLNSDQPPQQVHEITFRGDFVAGDKVRQEGLRNQYHGRM